MLGLLLVFVVSLFLTEIFTAIMLRCLRLSFDRAERTGLAGIVGLAFVGWFIQVLGQLTGSLQRTLEILVVVLLCLVFGININQRNRTKSVNLIQLPKHFSALALIAILFLSLLVCVGALSPADPIEWDSLAYHLAVPKIWMEAGHMVDIPFIHHSHFPSVVENLFLFGLEVGGENGAKAFNLAFFVFGLIWIFGYTRRKYNASAGWWSALAFASMPVVLWESGTAYIDVAHGLFAAIGILYAAEFLKDGDKRRLWIFAAGLGFAAASKYTGLQTIAITGLVVVFGLALTKNLTQNLKPIGIAAAVIVIIACPWYIRNVVTTGNPVYPFFYSVFGGKGWDQWRADIYANEQQTFGIWRTEGRRNPFALAPAVLGLAYQPGRYVNPQQDSGGGFPIGAIGIVPIVALVCLLATGKRRTTESTVLIITVVSLIAWFFLSQQSRYMTAIFIPICAIAGGLASRAGPGLAVSIAIVAQTLYSGWLQYTTTTVRQLPVVFGRQSVDEFRIGSSSFYEVAMAINELSEKSKIALFDEVFGFWLDRPYIWANPGHSTLIDYDSCKSGADLAQEFVQNGITHVYINLGMSDAASARKWLGAMGLSEAPGWTAAEREALLNDQQTRWKVLVADAVQTGQLKEVERFRSVLLFERVGG